MVDLYRWPVCLPVCLSACLSACISLVCLSRHLPVLAAFDHAHTNTYLKIRAYTHGLAHTHTDTHTQTNHKQTQTHGQKRMRLCVCVWMTSSYFPVRLRSRLDKWDGDIHAYLDTHTYIQRHILYTYSHRKTTAGCITAQRHNISVPNELSHLSHQSLLLLQYEFIAVRFYCFPYIITLCIMIGMST